MPSQSLDTQDYIDESAAPTNGALAPNRSGNQRFAEATSYSTSTWPYNSVVYLQVENPGLPSGSVNMGSGVIIGPHTILTAAHNVWDWEHQSGPTSIAVYPGYDGSFGTPVPDGQGSPIFSDYVHYYQIETPGGLISQDESEHDIAILEFSETFSSWFGYQTEFAGGTVHVTGYPASLDGLQEDSVGTVTEDPVYSVLNWGSLTGQISGGESGGPVWIDADPGPSVNPRVVGIVSTTGWAVQLTNDLLAQISEWIRADSYIWGGGDGGTWDDYDGGGGGEINLTTTLFDVNTNTGIGGSPSTTTVAGGIVRFHYKIANSGGTEASPGNIGYFISSDAKITAEDRFIVYGNRFDGVPANGDTGDIFADITLPKNLAAGTWYVGVIADCDDQVAESNDDDNASVGRAITITGGGGDGSTYIGVGSRNESFDLHLKTTAVTVKSGAGTDFVWGGRANDKLYGGAGRDVVIGDSGNDLLYGDDNADSPPGSADQLLGGVGNDTAYGGGGNDYINGEAGKDTLHGGNGSDLIYGGNGADLIVGGAGNDQLWGGSSPNPNGGWFGAAIFVAWNGVTGLAQTPQGWTIAGQAQSSDISSDTLRGGAGNDQIWGQGGNDTLFGDAGTDRLVGGLGTDNLTGGAGKDFFIFNSAKESVVGAKRDIVRDFHRSEHDQIDLRFIDPNPFKVGDQKFVYIGSQGFGQYHAAHPAHVGLLRFAGGVLSGDVNGDRVADFQIKVVGMTSLAMGDLLLSATQPAGTPIRPRRLLRSILTAASEIHPRADN
jgi:Ca2+-binding RTX toxin-like protein